MDVSNVLPQQKFPNGWRTLRVNEMADRGAVPLEVKPDVFRRTSSSLTIVQIDAVLQLRFSAHPGGVESLGQKKGFAPN